MRTLQAKTLVAVGSVALVWGCNRNPDGTGFSGDETAGETSSTSESDAGTSTGSSTGAPDDGEGTAMLEEPKYDVLAVPDEPAPPVVDCGGKPSGGRGSDVDSFIWISNNAESTVSKIDTVTLEEVGRYRTHPGDGDPSRTSVNLNGDVAVANRNGGLVMIHASTQHCEDRDDDGQIRTSTGPNDVLDWDDEECRAWFSPFDYATQRPVAWTAGQWNAEACRYEGAEVWTSGARNLGGGGEVDLDDIEVVRVDGATGDTIEVVTIPEVDPGFFGMYGGAVDADGDFWASQNGLGTLVRVPLDGSPYDTWPMPVDGYGITVDASGYVWTCALDVGRFDPVTEEWMVATAGGSGGCMADGQGTLWLANDPVIGLDTETLQVVSSVDVPEYVKGISIDFHGQVWAVSVSTDAYRIDPLTGKFETATGLSSPYTYSDMTGFALASAGGWTPAG